MGANQSTDSDYGNDPQRSSGQVKTCYYELLGVDRQATDEEIKRAYRRKALELHPDRNYGNVEETTNLFAEIQSAYEVLSDPQERSWYDSHRSNILRGDSEEPGAQYENNIRVTTSDDLMRLFVRFTGKVDFSESSNGFFSVLRGTFDVLANEELMACDWEGLEQIKYPSFGFANDNYEDVVRPFYAAWNGFATKKTFSWMDVYRTVDAPDRRVRRMMDKENKRFREEGIRDFNDTVRQLVAFVRKRDPRYKPNTQTDAERQKSIRDAASAQAARSRAANRDRLMQKEKVADWAERDEAIGEDPSEVEEEEPEEEFECVICRKVFKSEKQFDVHEKSKKHIKAAQRLRKSMLSEAEALDLNNDVDSTSSIAACVIVEEKGGSPTGSAEEPGSIEQSDVGEPGIKVGGNNGSNLDQVSENLGEDVQTGYPVDLASVSSAEDEGDECAPRNEVQERAQLNDADSGKSKQSLDIEDLSSRLAEETLDQDDGSSPTRKLGKAKEKRAKRAAQKAATDSTRSEFTCATCNAGFPSKTRLFHHIDDFKHARPTPHSARAGKARRR